MSDEGTVKDSQDIRRHRPPSELVGEEARFRALGANPTWTLRSAFDFGGVGPLEYRRKPTEAFRQNRCAI